MMIKYFLWLTQTVHLPIFKCLSLVRQIGSPKAVYDLSDSDMGTLRLKDAELQKLLKRELAQAEGILDECAQKGIKIVTIDDADYPPQLREIQSPPIVLFYRGTLPDWRSAPVVGIVGQRKVTPKGSAFTEKLSYELAQAGHIIVSGMAAGVDTAAHRGALRADGFTVAILGTGVDICFPAANNGLMRIIAQQGLLMSEYPPGVGGRPDHFPQRNRIISGLSRGIVVAEAQMRSGSLITARYALEQDRDVFACPGGIDQSAYEGTNYLVENGATPIYGSAVVINQYGRGKINNAGHESATAQPVRTSLPQFDGLCSTDKKVYNAIVENGSLDYIFSKVDASVGDIVRSISLMELRGYIIKINETKYECAI